MFGNTTIERLDELLWILRYGKPVRKISHQQILSHLDRIEKPVFFLSTGRCGTNWFAKVLDMASGVKSNHEPVPTFSMQSAYLYQLWNNESVPRKEKSEIAKNIFTAGREQHLRYAYKCDKRYVETNNQLTFFAPALAEMFPDAQFVHLYRHPGEVVRSGMRRGWFGENEPATLKIIKPSQESGVPWESYSQIQKIGWVWNETNLFVEEFLQSLEPGRKTVFNFNDKSIETVRELIDFLGMKISDTAVRKMMEKRVNRQKTGKITKFVDWSADKKAELRSVCGDLAEKYGYKI